MGNELDLWMVAVSLNSLTGALDAVFKCDGCLVTEPISLPNQVHFIILAAHEFSIKHRRCLTKLPDPPPVGQATSP